MNRIEPINSFGFQNLEYYNYLKIENLERKYNLEIDVLNDRLFEEKMIEESQNFMVLLQISLEDENTNFSEFGGDGIVYFGIHIDDLKNKDFDRVVAVFQNT